MSAACLKAMCGSWGENAVSLVGGVLLVTLLFHHCQGAGRMGQA